jgi:glycosyltransferase involved in cell wall biosynthesis
MPRVSVVIPAYDAAATVGAAVESVLWQTYDDLELVVVDDGSTDETGAIVAAHPGPIRLVHQENAGVGAARNRGIAEASGDLIAFCDADDLLLPRHLEALVETFDRGGGGLATANHYWLLPGGLDRTRVRYKGRFPRPDEQRRAILEQNFVSTLALFPRALVDEIGPFDSRLRHAEDWDFWLRAILAGSRVALQPRPLALYRWGDTGLSSDRQAMDDAIESILRAVAGRDDLTPDERAYVRRRLDGPSPRDLGRRGDEALRAGRYAEAARAYRDAAAITPSERPLVWKARVLSLAPPLVGPLERRRQQRRDRRTGFGPGHVK